MFRCHKTDKTYKTIDSKTEGSSQLVASPTARKRAQVDGPFGKST